MCSLQWHKAHFLKPYSSSASSSHFAYLRTISHPVTGELQSHEAERNRADSPGFWSAGDESKTHRRLESN